MSMDLPVVLIVFNRPDSTRRVLESLTKVKPSKLFIVADGPRASHPKDEDLCKQTRKLVEDVNWPCDIVTNFAESNLGLGHRVSSGVTWAFEHVEHAIILEDDCLVHPTFFPFCQELLVRYQDEDRIMHVAASNFQRGQRRNKASYYCSKYAHCWGWATWRRAWDCFDFDMKSWPSRRNEEWFAEILDLKKERDFWFRIWDDCHAGRTNTWAARWQYACWKNKGFSILPERNMVQNIGFNSAGTNTQRLTWKARLPALPVQFPLTHPPEIVREVEADRYTFNVHFRQTLVEKFRNFIFERMGGEYDHDTPTI